MDFLKIAAFLVCLITPNLSRASECDEFVTMVADKTLEYHSQHRIWPAPLELIQLANVYLPTLTIHPDSWKPIDFEDYLKAAKVKPESESSLSIEQLSRLSPQKQCNLHLDADKNIEPPDSAPVYVQAFSDKGPDGLTTWTYLKYNWIFDWSGLAETRSAWASIGAFFTGGSADKWHRLDIHTSAILGFDHHKSLRTMTLMQHNYSQTYVVNQDFDLPIKLVSAKQSNELYIDRQSTNKQQYRVVPFLDDWPWLIDGTNKPFLWAMDETFGINAGGQQVKTHVQWIEPQHILARFRGLLAAPDRTLGIYTGRDGPPGYDYFALPEFLSMPNAVVMGSWRQGDSSLVRSLAPHLKGWQDSDWNAILSILRKKLIERLDTE